MYVRHMALHVETKDVRGEVEVCCLLEYIKFQTPKKVKRPSEHVEKLRREMDMSSIKEDL
jgi:hypothetical protein